MNPKNRKAKDTITIFWTPGRFVIEDESWNMLYKEPQSLLQNFFKESKDTAKVRRCPAARDSLKNVFSFNSSHSENIIFPEGYLENLDSSPEENIFLDLEGTLGLNKERHSNYENHVNLSYNMSWFFFSSEPVEAKMTSPYFPPQSPTPGSRLFSGVFDIGSWYRPFNLEYLVPIDAESFIIEPEDALFYLEVKTDKKIVFQRYHNTQRLQSIAREAFLGNGIFGKNQTLQSRYNRFTGSKVRNMVLDEISKNLVSEYPVAPS